MPLNIEEVRRIAQDVAAAHDPNLNVLAAMTAEGGSDYIEVLVVDTACGGEPCRFIVGADRTTTESELRATIGSHVRRHLAHSDRR